MEIHREHYNYDPLTGDEKIVTTHKTVGNEEALFVVEEQRDRLSDYVWYVVALVEGLLLLRLLFILFGANDVGFVSLLYAVTDPLVLPFKGIFNTTDVGGGYFDPATFVALMVDYLIGWALVAVVDLSTERSIHAH